MSVLLGALMIKKIALMSFVATLGLIRLSWAGVCGDGIVDAGEACDGNTSAGLSGLTCASVAAGFKSGTLKCRPDCQGYDASQCVEGGVISAASCSSSDVQAAINVA